jgi:hypothetical protein
MLIKLPLYMIMYVRVANEVAILNEFSSIVDDHV